MKKIFFISFLALFVLSFLISPVLAAEFQAGPQYVLSKDATVGGNLYAAGNNININGKVEGDLISAGQTINVFGKVAEDLIAAGANINIMGEVGGDLRTAGGFITIGSEISGDTLAAGGEIQVIKDINLFGDIKLAGGSIDVQGNLFGPARIEADKVVINGRVDKDIFIRAKNELVVGDNAVIEGKLRYEAPKPATIAGGAQVKQSLEYQVLKSAQKGAQRRVLWGVFTVFWLIKLVIVLFAALVVYWLFQKWTEAFVEETIANFGREAVRGFVFLIIVPVAVVISFITIIGSFFGIVGILWYIASVLVAGVLSGVVFGGWLSKYLYNQPEYTIDWKTISLGVILLAFIGLIPIVGWLVAFIIFLAAFGNLLNLCYRRVWIAREEE